MNITFETVLSQLYLVLNEYKQRNVASMSGNSVILFDSDKTVKGIVLTDKLYHKLYCAYSLKDRQFRFVKSTVYNNNYSNRIIHRKNYDIMFNEIANILCTSALSFIGTFDTFAEHKISLIKIGKHTKALLYDPDNSQVVIHTQVLSGKIRRHTFTVLRVNKNGYFRAVQTVKFSIPTSVKEYFYLDYPVNFDFVNEAVVTKEHVLTVYPSLLLKAMDPSLSEKQQYKSLLYLSDETRYKVLVYTNGRIKAIPMWRLKDNQANSIAKKRTGLYGFFPRGNKLFKYYDGKRKQLLRGFKIEPVFLSKEKPPYGNGVLFFEDKQLPKGITYDKASDQLAGLYKSLKLYRRHNKKDHIYAYTIVKNGQKIGTFELGNIKDTYKFLLCPRAIVKKRRNKFYIFEIFHTKQTINSSIAETTLIRRSVIKLNKDNSVKVLRSEYIDFANIQNGGFISKELEGIAYHMKFKMYSDSAFKINKLIFVKKSLPFHLPNSLQFLSSIRPNSFFVSGNFRFLNNRFIVIKGKNRLFVYDLKESLMMKPIVDKCKKITLLTGFDSKEIFYATFVKANSGGRNGVLSLNKIVVQQNNIAVKNIVNIKINSLNYSLVYGIQDKDFLYLVHSYVVYNSKRYFAVLEKTGHYHNNKYRLMYLCDKQKKRIVNFQDTATSVLFVGREQVDNWLKDRDKSIEAVNYDIESQR